MFLIRAAFWLSIVILLIPSGETPQEQGSAATVQAQLSPVDAFGAARDTVADLSSFCQRNPETCETGSAAFRVLAHKAQHGAEMLYEYVSAENADANPDASDASEEDPMHARQGTLNESDLKAPWQGPDLQS